MSCYSVIAKRLIESKATIPHYYLTVDILLDEVINLRDYVNKLLVEKVAKGEKPDQISINDILIKAASIACRRVPECNSSWQGEFIRQ
ncbi:unnamed protein product [Protopolystoma xenopodis]|uniref:2-oxoacid dehydrogenase acyltransferase catalytic domain-containing protein n=1 Tax=Protopolystoma xenopodis TaxID=117903 RepID=A0A448WSM7_9PLAT|nr:unnamed protein product [Protopolystoma xenopodis]